MNDTDPPFEPDLSVIDVAAWLRIKDEDWMSHVAFHDEDDIIFQEDAA